jgi:transcriptional regulator with XRE-family HTH domain
MEYFGLKLQTLRKKASMSQENLAELMGVSRQAISKWERSEALPDLYNAKKLAEIFNITLDELMDIEIKSIDKSKEKTNKISLAFLTVPGVLVGVLIIVGFVEWISNMMVLIDLNISGIVFYLMPLAIIAGMFYIYSLFNLYIGNNVKKFRVVVLAYNFVFLLMFIILLVSVDLYNSATGVILLILILAIIVLGIIGGFMYDTTIEENKVSDYQKTLNLFTKTMRIFACFAAVVLFISTIYSLLTHTVVRETNIIYVFDDEPDDLWGGFIDFSDSDKAMLSYMYFDDTFNPAEIDEVIIYFNEELIFSSDDFDIKIYDEAGFYINFEYRYDDAMNLGGNAKIAVDFIIDSTIYQYSYDYTVKTINHENVTVPIWVKE